MALFDDIPDTCVRPVSNAIARIFVVLGVLAIAAGVALAIFFGEP